MRSLLLGGIAAGALAMTGAGVAHAQVQTGAVWEVSTGNASTPVIPGPSSVPQTTSLSSFGTPTATFIPNPINYSSPNDSSLTGFLNNPTFLTGASHANDGIDGDLFQFTGNIGLLHGENSFVVGHDDGVWLSVTGIGVVVSKSDKTSFSVTPFSVSNPGAYRQLLLHAELRRMLRPAGEARIRR